MTQNYSYYEIATRYDLWMEYFDVDGLDTFEAFEARTVEEKIELIFLSFGADTEPSREWIITWESGCVRDDETEKTADAYTYLVSGPRDGRAERFEALARGEGVTFRLYDDDGILYYQGRYFGLDGDEEMAFGPLDDYGINAGCTELRYEQKNITQVGSDFVTL
ncbi:MAG: hypothetical protein EBU49_00315 [Proteobacteria bacterium]|nr:hypothetical protein [Pseudomonadota bacterium]